MKLANFKTTTPQSVLGFCLVCSTPQCASSLFPGPWLQTSLTLHRFFVQSDRRVCQSPFQRSLDVDYRPNLPPPPGSRRRTVSPATSLAPGDTVLQRIAILCQLRPTTNRKDLRPTTCRPNSPAREGMPSRCSSLRCSRGLRRRSSQPSS